MIRFCALVSLLTVAATGAMAQDVRVRSGEHDGYTRLVFDVPPGTSWDLAHKKNGARLTIAMDGVTYQTGSVFERLSANRLASVSQSKPGDTLDMEFGCDCVASAFQFRSSMIVVDIGPGALPPPLTFDVPPWPDRQGIGSDQRANALKPSVGTDQPVLDLGARKLMNQLSTRLLQGADREVLGLTLTPVGPRASQVDKNTALSLLLGSNLHLSTVLDELDDLLGSKVQQIETVPRCITTAELAFEHWSDTRPFSVQVADLRVGLFHEFDRLDDDRVLQLAKLYAFHGFGVEARQTLELLENPPIDATWVKVIAGIMDEKSIPTPSPFRSQQRCDSDAALWALLADQKLAADAETEAIEMAFLALPGHLRQMLGPRLSSIFSDALQVEAARRVMRSVGRVGSGKSPEVSQAMALMATADGQKDIAEAHLTDVVTASGAKTEAPLALARLVEKRWADRGAVSAQEVGLAGAFAVEFRRSEIGPLMKRTHAIALGLNQEFDTAFDLVQSLADNAESVATINRHFQLLTERSDDITFLRQTLKFPSEIERAMSTDTAVAVSARLASLGFSDHAYALANRSQDKTQRGERARIRATAALANDRPHQALLELSEDTSDDANELRVQALNETRDFAAAGALLRSMGETDPANRFYWLAGLPERIDPSAPGEALDLSTLSNGLLDPPARELDKPLADAAGLLQDSVAMRNALAEMLDRVDGDLQQSGSVP